MGRKYGVGESMVGEEVGGKSMPCSLWESKEKGGAVEAATQGT